MLATAPTHQQSENNHWRRSRGLHERALVCSVYWDSGFGIGVQLFHWETGQGHWDSF